MLEFTPTVKNKSHLHFQCSDNMTVEQICSDINDYIFAHKDELYIDKTEAPIYLKRYVLVKEIHLWDT